MTKAYWWREVINWGDELAPFLLRHFAGVEVEWDTISRSSIVSVGSVLEHIPPLWDGYILGSGRLFENSRLHTLKRATILAVRGPLSAKGIPGSFALGDPGVLADELVGFQEKKFDLGIVPHWKDKELVPRFKAMIHPPSTIEVINPHDSPIKIITQIASCRRIVTSSLHGLIVADAFGLPRRVEYCPALGNEGKDFKFHDYSASIGAPLTWGVMSEPPRWKVEDVRFAIADAYKLLAKKLVG